jgi:formylglycine-generating enzyme required for sulfatase activity
LVPNLIDKTLGIVLPPAAGNCDGVEITVGQNDRRCFKPGAGKAEWFKDCPDCPEMVVVPAGTFTMGSPRSELMRNDKDESQVQVTISKAFAVGRSAVTRGEYSVFVAETNRQSADKCLDYTISPTHDVPYEKRNWRSPGFSQTDRHPVICVGWHDASAYVSWLSIKTGKQYRMLSEAEREYVTRAGTSTAYWWGDRISISQANYNGWPYRGGKGGKARNTTTPVDMFPSNPWGLRDVHGNVEEWIEDCRSTGDGAEPTLSLFCPRVLRGGSWANPPDRLRAASRFTTLGEGPMTDVGFRVARSLQQ